MPILSPHLFYRGLVHNGLIAWYDPGWQILTGQTGQTLIDRAGKGNTAQLGSTAGVDANDPAFSSGGITFGADDYVLCTQNAFDDLAQFTVITVFKANSAGGSSAGRIFDKSNRLFRVGSNMSLVYIQARTSNNNQWTSTTLLTAETNYITSISYDGNNPDTTPKIWLNNTILTTNKSGTGSGACASDAANNLYIGNNAAASANLDGTIFAQLWYNCILPDSEYLQVYNYLRRLMASRGITI